MFSACSTVEGVSFQPKDIPVGPISLTLVRFFVHPFPAYKLFTFLFFSILLIDKIVLLQIDLYNNPMPTYIYYCENRDLEMWFLVWRMLLKEWHLEPSDAFWCRQSWATLQTTNPRYNNFIFSKNKPHNPEGKD